MKNSRIFFAFVLALMVAAIVFSSTAFAVAGTVGTVPPTGNGAGFCEDQKEVHAGNASVFVFAPVKCKIHVTKVDSGYGRVPAGFDVLSSTVRVLIFDKQEPVNATFEVCFPRVPKTESQIYQWAVDSDGVGSWTGLRTYTNSNAKELCAMAYSTGIFALLGK